MTILDDKINLKSLLVLGVMFFLVTLPFEGRSESRIPIEALFTQGIRQNLKLSPSGDRLSYFAPYHEGYTTWIKSDEVAEDECLITDKGDNVGNSIWAYDNQHLLYSADSNGSENTEVYSYNLTTREEKCITNSLPKATHPTRSVIINTSPFKPDTIVIASNNRDPRIFDLYSFNLKNNQYSVLFKSEVTILNTFIDINQNVLGYIKMDAKGNGVFCFLNVDTNEFKNHFTIPRADLLDLKFIGFNSNSSRIRFLDSTKSNSTKLVEYDIADKTFTDLFADESCDVTQVYINPHNQRVLAVGIERARLEWRAVNEEFNSVLEYLSKIQYGDYSFVHTSANGKTVIVSYTRDNGPISYYKVDLENLEATHIFNHTDSLKSFELAKSQPISYKASDGMLIQGYLTLPNSGQKPYPTMLYIHGGPWQRDSWGYNPVEQFCASRGWACLRINYRGSAGLGKSCLDAGNREWGGKMQTDITEGVLWAIKAGFTDHKRIVISGVSFGGYSALWGIIRHPELYKAAVTVSPVADLEAFLINLPPYWSHLYPQFDLRIGELPRYSEGDNMYKPKLISDYNIIDKQNIEFLKASSPIYFCDQIKVPVYIFAGANDPRVSIKDTDNLITILQKHNVEHTVKVYKDEGHTLVNSNNIIDFLRELESILDSVQ